MVTWLKYPRYTLDSWNANAQDDDGTLWYVEASDIRDGLAPKTHYEERPTGPGAWWSRSYQSGKPVTVSGYGRAVSLAARERARNRLLGLFVDGGLHTLTYDSGDSIRTMKVGLNGVPRFAVRRNTTAFGWQLPLFNPDGVMYGATPRTTPAVQSSSLATDGLDWETGGGLDWDEGGQGLDWGTSGSGGFLSMDNPGNVEAWPVFTLTGPLVQPTLTDPLTGRQLYYSGTLGVGQTLIIDTSPANRSVKLDGIDRFGFMLSAQWMSIPAGGSLLVQFGGSGVGTAMATWQEVYI